MSKEGREGRPDSMGPPDPVGSAAAVGHPIRRMSVTKSGRLMVGGRRLRRPRVEHTKLPTIMSVDKREQGERLALPAVRIPSMDRMARTAGLRFMWKSQGGSLPVRMIQPTNYKWWTLKLWTRMKMGFSNSGKISSFATFVSKTLVRPSHILTDCRGRTVAQCLGGYDGGRVNGLACRSENNSRCPTVHHERRNCPDRRKIHVPRKTSQRCNRGETLLRQRCLSTSGTHVRNRPSCPRLPRRQQGHTGASRGNEHAQVSEVFDCWAGGDFLLEGIHPMFEVNSRSTIRATRTLVLEVPRADKSNLLLLKLGPPL